MGGEREGRDPPAVFIGNPAAEMIEILLNPDPAAWRGYCGRHHAALFTHLRGWSSALAAAYDLPVFFLLARAAAAPGDTAGILPLLLFSPPGGTRRLISLPYTDAAGIVADSDAVRRRLLAAALELAAATGAAHLELRQYGRFEIVPPLSALTDWQCTAHSFKIGLDRLLPATTAELWDDLPAKVRNQVRKAWRCGCVVRIGGGELVDDVHGVFSDNMRDLGSPTHGVELFRQVIGQDDLRARCIVVYHRGRPGRRGDGIRTRRHPVQPVGLVVAAATANLREHAAVLDDAGSWHPPGLPSLRFRPLLPRDIHQPVQDAVGRRRPAIVLVCIFEKWA